MASIENSVVFNTRFLFSIQELMVASFRSRHKSVVNESIAMWNKTFGIEDTLEYPEDLRTILQKLRSVTELRLPSFPERYGEEVSRLSLPAENARTYLSRACLHLCVSSTPKMKRCKLSLLCLFNLQFQSIHYKALQSLSRGCGSDRTWKTLLLCETHQLQHNGKTKLLQKHDYGTMIPKYNSLPLTRHLCSLSQSNHST